MRNTSRQPRSVATKIVLFIAYPIVFALGLVLLFRGIKTVFAPPIDGYLAIVGFAVYFYAFGRLALGLNARLVSRRSAEAKKQSAG